jgi:hypothetical protein
MLHYFEAAVRRYNDMLTTELLVIERNKTYYKYHKKMYVLIALLGVLYRQIYYLSIPILLFVKALLFT